MQKIIYFHDMKYKKEKEHNEKINVNNKILQLINEMLDASSIFITGDYSDKIMVNIYIILEKISSIAKFLKNSKIDLIHINQLNQYYETLKTTKKEMLCLL